MISGCNFWAPKHQLPDQSQHLTTAVTQKLILLAFRNSLEQQLLIACARCLCHTIVMRRAELPGLYSVPLQRLLCWPQGLLEPRWSGDCRECMVTGWWLQDDGKIVLLVIHSWNIPHLWQKLWIIHPVSQFLLLCTEVPRSQWCALTCQTLKLGAQSQRHWAPETDAFLASRV